MDEEILAAVRKKALGFCSVERTEEQQITEDGQVQTVKVRLVTKEVPPDIAAVKCLMEMGDRRELEDMTAEQLECEKMRLLRLLKENQQNETDKKSNQNSL